MRKSCLKLEFHFGKEYSVFLLKSVLCNYVIIALLHVAACTYRELREG